MDMGSGSPPDITLIKLPSELSLIECAFIAGSVKQPNYYNPFIKKTEESSELARARAQTRITICS